MSLNLIPLLDTIRGAALMTPEPHRQVIFKALDKLNPFMEGLEWIHEEGHTLRCDSLPTGGDDYQTQWAVVSHYQRKPQERDIAYGSTLDAAIHMAMTDPLEVGPSHKLRAVAPVTHGLTDDPSDPRLKRGPDTEPGPQNEVYLVLSEEERAKGFVRPLRRSYRHVGLPGADKYPFDKPTGCGAVTTMGLALCETYAREPKFYGSTYCTHCQKHLPVGEFVWSEDGQVVGS